ncbi:MAG: polyprenyl synthetase family protein [Puniceicoccaceae bacterium]|nr:MAG: polyprenyl synthetase family protein [Puniceicoccaceae bacterium]
MLADSKATRDNSAAATLPRPLSLLQEHFASLDRFLLGRLPSFEEEIRTQVAYCLESGGKRIRPALTFLSGWRSDHAVTEDAVRLAAVIELVHLATLVHDDIMDDASIRRSRSTAAQKFGPATAVLLGDALFAHAVELAAAFPTPDICRRVAQATRKVCSGEIIQSLRPRETAPDRGTYLRIIELKTAELFAVSCELGASVAGQSAAFVDAVARFGRDLGIAYQMYDDLADFFGTEDRIGKTLGTDLATGKPTLPLFILLECSEPDRAAAIHQALASGDADATREVLASLRRPEILANGNAEVLRRIEAARDLLRPFNGDPAATHLADLADLLEAQLARLGPG